MTEKTSTYSNSLTSKDTRTCLCTMFDTRYSNNEHRHVLVSALVNVFE